MTSLLNGTPDAAIWNSADLGQVELEVVSRPEQVVYSVDPSGTRSIDILFPVLLRRTIVELHIILRNLVECDRSALEAKKPYPIN